MPYSDGRLLQSGVKEFLQRRGEVLGDGASLFTQHKPCFVSLTYRSPIVIVPLVIVLTKADLLEGQLKIDMMKDNLKGKPFEQYRSEFLEKYCIGPLRKVAGDVPYVIVSSTCQITWNHVVY